MSKKLDTGLLEYAIGDVNSEEKGSGARANEGKVSLSLIPFHLFAGAARVLMAGKLKYADWNWAKGMNWSIPVDCILRHLSKWWWLGEDNDEETGEHHLDYIICNLIMLRHYVEAYKAGDDRPDTSLTSFPEAWENFVKLFDEKEFLERNPAIQEKVNAERRKG
jgi:hypothetical protein